MSVLNPFKNPLAAEAAMAAMMLFGASSVFGASNNIGVQPAPQSASDVSNASDAPKYSFVPVQNSPNLVRVYPNNADPNPSIVATVIITRLPGGKVGVTVAGLAPKDADKKDEIKGAFISSLGTMNTAAPVAAPVSTLGAALAATTNPACVIGSEEGFDAASKTVTLPGGAGTVRFINNEKVDMCLRDPITGGTQEFGGEYHKATAGSAIQRFAIRSSGYDTVGGSTFGSGVKLYIKSPAGQFVPAGDTADGINARGQRTYEKYSLASRQATDVAKKYGYDASKLDVVRSLNNYVLATGRTLNQAPDFGGSQPTPGSQ